MSVQADTTAPQLILHITQRSQWEQARREGTYRGDTLDTEGFIHCSTPAQIVKVANKFFFQHQELIVLCIDSRRVLVEIKYEESEPEEQYPHIYGSLNIDAVIQVIEFARGANGKFEFPPQLVGFT
ncbi:MAG: hypothetical protein N4J56_006361 [Chroococcidiopsis sp. SAG 2025]|uniref:DUF952 domain-containing protein n=1 Tax=Chroococcidiopsis sp. SAG 2025 TaxID=171389 RepID=UPI0029371847|nr:DUF952 domain-containing protein [Chroococcidiopsis sp. SAG 2025]MDV2996707.1 hypothetical protein [Chroococcidiopsis sp. SAG 2025]